jgi:glycosyltransferase involved in cell wall biosynthesis
MGGFEPFPISKLGQSSAGRQLPGAGAARGRYHVLSLSLGTLFQLGTGRDKDGDVTDQPKNGSTGPVGSTGPKYSIVIPAYNESARIPATLASVVECVRTRGWDAEVLVVNDGSEDQTADLVRAFAVNAPEVRLIENPGNRGKGYSVRAGMLESRGEIAMFTDSDLSAPIEEAERLFTAIEGGADIAIGSRWLESGRQTHRQPLYRQLFGRCFNAVTRMVMGLRFADTQCGFKAFTREAAQTVFQLQTIERWGFDPEILFIALKRGYQVQEVAVSWAHDERTRMSYLKDGLKMLEEIAVIRWNALTGHYSKRIEAFQRTGEAQPRKGRP